MALKPRHSRIKHERISEQIFEQILTGQYGPGDRIPTEHELADQYEASRPTVARALSELEKRGLIDRRPGAGTFVRRPHPSRERKLGILAPRQTLEPPEFAHFVSLFSKVISRISRCAHDHGYVLLMNDLPYGDEAEMIRRARAATRQLIDLQLKGVFFMPLEVTPEHADINEQIAAELRAADVAVVLLDRDLRSGLYRGDFDLVGIDNERAAYVLTDYLLGLGCRRIDFVAGLHDASAVSERIAGHRKALEAAGIDPKQRCVHRFGIQPFAQDNELLERRAVAGLLEGLDAEALVCGNDRTAATIMHHGAALGVQVPRDLRIVGFDDEAFGAYLATPLTTMRQPADTLAAEAMWLMASRIEQPDLAPRAVRARAELVVRASCGGGNAAADTARG